MRAETPAMGAPASVEAAREATPFAWSVRRELWENRYVYLLPLAAGLIFVTGFLVSLITMPERMSAAFALPAAQRHAALTQPYTFVALVMMAVGVVGGSFYSLEALYSERRDRSILFWKSLPVSDTATVLAKAAVPMLVLPLFTAAAAIVAQLIMLLLGSIALGASGLSVATLWREVAPVQGALVLLYHLVAIHGLGYAPLFAWLLLASATARRAPFLWAAIPPFAIGVVEYLAFGSSRFVEILQSRLGGGAESAAGTTDMPIDPLMPITPGAFLASPGLWVGLALTAVFLFAAIRIRRYRGAAS